jgi:putative transposase
MLFLSFVEKAKRKFHFRLWDFCIMGNHIHFLIKPGKEGDLSEIMQWIKCNFAKAWNKKQGRTGHVWGERFYSRIIDGMADFLRVREYIEENPVKAGLVERAAEWVFGSLYHRLRPDRDQFRDKTFDGGRDKGLLRGNKNAGKFVYGHRLGYQLYQDRRL